MLLVLGRTAPRTPRLFLWVLTTAVALVGCANDSFDRELDQFLQWFRVRDGAVVADIGAGKGQYAIALSQHVGSSGRVIATEIEAEKREAIVEAAQEAGADRVEVVEAQIEGTGLAPQCCDAIVLRDVYHHLAAPEAFVQSLFDTLRPGGRIAIVDFPPTAWLALFTPDGIPEDRGGHGIAPEIVIRELEAVGFVHLDSVDTWPSNNFVTRTYGLLFERPAAATGNVGRTPR